MFGRILSNLPNRALGYGFRLKSKDRGGGKKKIGKIAVDAKQLSSVIELDELKERMQSNVDKLVDDYAKHVSLRAQSGSVETLRVPFDGKEYELQELSQVVRKNPKMIVLNMATFPQAIPSVLRALADSGMNLNPQQDGTALFVPVPKITKEHRDHLAKNAKVLFNKCRDAIKDVETEQLKKLKRKEGLSEDLAFNVRRQINTLTDEYLTKAKELSLAKHNELLKIN